MPQLRAAVEVSEEDQQQLADLEERLEDATAVLDSVHQKTGKLESQIAALKEEMKTLKKLEVRMLAAPDQQRPISEKV